MIIEVGITYLEMTNRSQLNPRRSDVDGLEIKRAELPLPEFNRFLYTAVGGDWYWVDRLGWTYQQWKEWVERPDMHTWIASINGTPIGYFELDKEENYVEISKFELGTWARPGCNSTRARWIIQERCTTIRHVVLKYTTQERTRQMCRGGQSARGRNRDEPLTRMLRWRQICVDNLLTPMGCR